MCWSRGSTVIVYVPVTGNVNVSRNAVGAARRTAIATVAAVRMRTVRSTPGIVFPLTVSVSFWPAVAVNVRTAFSPIVPIVTVVGVPIAVVPVLSGTALNVNVNVPVFWSRGSTVIV